MNYALLVYHIWASLAAFAVGFCLPEVAFTAVPFVNGMPVPIVFNDPTVQGVSNYFQIVPFAKSQWSGVTTKEVTTPMVGLATTTVDQGV